MSFKVKLTDEEYRQYIKDMNDMGLEDKHKDKPKDLSTKNQYVYFLDGTKVSYDPTLLQALEKGVRLATNEETKEKIRDEINYIKKQIRDKQFVDLGTPKKDAITIKFSNKNHLNSPTKLATKKSLALESFNEKYFMSSYSREDLYKNLTKEDLKEANKDLEKELGIGNFCYSPEIDLNEEDFLSQYNNTKDKDVFLQDLYSLLKLANERNNAEDIKNIQDKINLILNKQLKGDIKVSSKVSLKQKNKKEPDLIVNKSLAYENLEEDIEKHDTLNPLLFDEDDELKPEIKEAIEKIVNQFVEDLKTDGIKIEVKDVILVGSNVSYNYTKDSDLDVHIIVDKDTLNCNPEIYTLLYGAYRSLFNKNYDITIKGTPVEIYVELV